LALTFFVSANIFSSKRVAKTMPREKGNVPVMASAVKGVESPKVQSSVVEVIDTLKQRFRDRCATSLALREQHGHTTTWLANQPPDAVVFAENTEEVAEVVRLCAQHKVPIIPFGTGSSLEGHVNAPLGGISVDLSRMDKILEVNSEDLDCRVEAGVTRKHLNSYLRDTGLFFPIDPGADASIGGMAATRASGTNAVRYGTMKDAVLGLTIVTADGRIIKTGGRARKSSAGYDLTRLFVGSEGTLGVITELTLRLHGQPEAISGGVCPFPDVHSACNAVISTIQMGIPVARIELLDSLQVKACNAYSKLDLAETPTLFLEFHGSDAGVREQSELFSAIAEEYGGGPFDWATAAEERTKLWTARHDAYWSGKSLKPDSQVMVTDVCVPISRLAECVSETAEDISARGLLAPIVGHVGDGNFHVQILVDLDNKEEMRVTEDFVEQLSLRAIGMGGTCTGEHGVGQGKQKYLRREHGDALEVMRTIKQALDPDNVMNPGKILPQS
jgi:D-lactate dehydrogenase (cytochrome)